MKVVSLVPSWTETLCHAGIEVVGRTRFCIHPSSEVKKIPVVGGTKDVDWNLIRDLKPDVVLFDKEENTLTMSRECPYPVLTTHVTSLTALAKELQRLSQYFENSQLLKLSAKTQQILQAPKRLWNEERLPGLIDWVHKPTMLQKPVIYLIWKNPWMAASRETYIGSILEHLGAKLVEFPCGEKYPRLHLEEYPNSLFLFSSEPFPFHRQTAELQELGLEGAIVNGEAFSWFGIRSLTFLHKIFSEP